MSDYSTPTVTDESVSRLATNIRDFAEDVRDLIINCDANIQEVLNKQYAVNHEPQIELPFSGEYDYICEKVNKSLASRKKLDKFTHIFISGYLPNGKTIRNNSIEKDDSGISHSRYAGLYINGTYYYGDYTCRAEEGGRERLNVLVVGAPKMGSDKARLDVDYADIPLENFKMILYDDVDEPINPDIDSFLGSKQIDTLKVIGNYKWTYSGLCTLRRLELTKDILVINQMDCPCIQELIIPNVTEIPTLNGKSATNGSIVKLDIANVQKVKNINGANLSGDLSLNCSSLSGLQDCGLDTISTGNKCTDIVIDYKMANKLICGANITALDRLSNTTGVEAQVGTLKEIVFQNALPLSLGGWVFNYFKSTLETITFSELAAITGTLTNSSNSIRNISFTAPITNRVDFSTSPKLTEQSVLNIINALDTESKVTVALNATTKQIMQSAWYCKLSDGVYVACTSDDEGAITQESALYAKGGTLS